MDLPARITSGVEALRAARWHDAVTALSPVVGDPDLAAADELRDVRARVLSLYAQACVEAGALEPADRACRDALRLLRALGDKPGIDTVRALQDRVVQALAREREQAARREEMARVAATPIDTLLAGATTDAARTETLLRKAHAHADTDTGALGAPLATEAIDLADRLADTRLQVLARLARARCAPDHALSDLVQARDIADAAGEFNLIATIARAAEVAGVDLPREEGPHAPRREDP